MTIIWADAHPALTGRARKLARSAGPRTLRANPNSDFYRSPPVGMASSDAETATSPSALGYDDYSGRRPPGPEEGNHMDFGASAAVPNSTCTYRAGADRHAGTLPRAAQKRGIEWAPDHPRPHLTPLAPTEAGADRHAGTLPRAAQKRGIEWAPDHPRPYLTPLVRTEQELIAMQAPFPGPRRRGIEWAPEHPRSGGPRQRRARPVRAG